MDDAQWEQAIGAEGLATIDAAARYMADLLQAGGVAGYTLSPGDSTRYDVLVCRRPGAMDMPGAPFVWASNFGKLHPWAATGETHWTYIDGKLRCGEWTARVFDRLLNGIAGHLGRGRGSTGG